MLDADAEMFRGDSHEGANYRLDFKQDGDLVLSRKHDHALIWSSGTAGTAADWVVMFDGELRIYGDFGVLWKSDAVRSPGAVLSLVDGSLIVEKCGEVLWRSGDTQCKLGLATTQGVCCRASCGSCGGPGCSGRRGGAKACCAGNIMAAKRSCGSALAPCMMP
jgi:hypothetical protein